MFATLQKFGKALMLPIALLPAAGILLGIGGSFTNPTLIESHGWGAILGAGTVLGNIFTVMNGVGGIVFGNLPLLFAAGVAAGLAKREKGTAVVAGVVAFLILNETISMILSLQGVTNAILADTYTADMAVKAGLIKKAAEFISWKAHFTTTVGIFTLQTSVFGGIIAGVIGAVLNNKFCQISLPDVLAFFGGSRFVPIITTVVAIFAGVILAFVWPYVQMGIGALGALVKASGLFGSFMFGYIERSLIPFGLHHIFYLPFWQTDLGGVLKDPATGKIVATGAQNIFFYQLGHADSLKWTHNHFEVLRGTRFMAGKFPFMMFGLWGAALAFYRTADADKKKETAGLVFSAAFTSFLTGITEPLEFSFLFAAPVLYYGVHAVLAGISFTLMTVLNVGVGMTFSGGAIDYTLFGLLPGLDKTSAHWVIVVGVALFFAYWLIFEFAIRTFNLQTPGRGDAEMASADQIQAKKYGNGESAAAKPGAGSNDELTDKIIEALGGDENIEDIDACITKLRVSVSDKTKVVDDSVWTEKLEAIGIAMGKETSGKGMQIAYGPRADVLKGIMNEKLGRD